MLPSILWKDYLKDDGKLRPDRPDCLKDCREFLSELEKIRDDNSWTYGEIHTSFARKVRNGRVFVCMKVNNYSKSIMTCAMKLGL